MEQNQRPEAKDLDARGERKGAAGRSLTSLVRARFMISSKVFQLSSLRMGSRSA